MRLIDVEALYKNMCDAVEVMSVLGRPIEAAWLWETLNNTIEKATIYVPKENKGQWINHRNDNGHNIADCSICGNSIQWFDDDEKPRFCCMCGADNRGEECGKNN